MVQSSLWFQPFVTRFVFIPVGEGIIPCQPSVSSWTGPLQDQYPIKSAVIYCHIDLQQLNKGEHL